MISFKQSGDLKKLTNYLERVKSTIKISNLDKYGKAGVAALQAATPVDSGKTASSWYYKIDKTKSGVSIIFNNSNIQNEVPIAIILQYGHGTKNGGWVQGRDYINPSIKPIFDKMVEDIWREVTRV